MPRNGTDCAPIIFVCVTCACLAVLLIWQIWQQVQLDDLRAGTTTAVTNGTTTTVIATTVPTAPPTESVVVAGKVGGAVNFHDGLRVLREKIIDPMLVEDERKRTAAEAAAAAANQKAHGLGVVTFETPAKVAPKSVFKKLAEAREEQKHASAAKPLTNVAVDDANRKRDVAAKGVSPQVRFKSQVETDRAKLETEKSEKNSDADVRTDEDRINRSLSAMTEKETEQKAAVQQQQQQAVAQKSNAVKPNRIPTLQERMRARSVAASP